MTRLSVNINKIATLRNSRGGNVPDVKEAAIKCQDFGADGITVHPRPDERHIRRQDVYDLRSVVNTEFNIEGYPSEEFIKLILDVKPEQVTLVPDPPEAITSNTGWNTAKNKDFLIDVISRLKDAGIRTSIFVDPDVETIKHAADTGTDRIELYTEPYARKYPGDPKAAVKDYVSAASAAFKAGIGINAGHDLSLENLAFLTRNIPTIQEVSIGHALIAEALYLGLEETIKRYKSILN